MSLVAINLLAAYALLLADDVRARITESHRSGTDRRVTPGMAAVRSRGRPVLRIV
jgi:hypothetical protein